MIDQQMTPGAHRAPDRAAEVIEHAQHLADAAEWLADNVAEMPNVSVTTNASGLVTLYPNGAGQMAECVRWLSRGSKISQPVTKRASGELLTVERHFGAYTIAAAEYRSVVCEQVRVGTEIVQVPDPNYPPAPMVTEAREIYEWRCGSLLAAIESEVGF